MAKSDEEIEDFLRKQLQEAEKELDAHEAKGEPLRNTVRRLRASLDEFTAGSKSSKDIADDDIVAYIAKAASKSAPLSSREIAAGLGLDTRGIARRLPRMVSDGMIHGDKTDGYWADGRRK